MDKPTFSIIILPLGQKEYLTRALNSVTEQSYGSWECIVIDHNNASQSIANEYTKKDDRFKYHTITNKNIGSIKNYAVERSLGEYLLFLNLCDILNDKLTLENIYNSIDPKFKIIYGNYQKNSDNGASQTVKIPDNINIESVLQIDLPFQCFVFERNLFMTQCGLYKEDLEYLTDWAFFLKLVALERVRFLYIPSTISSICDIKKIEEKEFVEKERDRILTDYFSLELFEIINSYYKLRRFHSKKIFKLIRKLKNIIKISVSPNRWKSYIYNKRIMSIIRIINKTVRLQEKNPLSIPVVIINYNRLNDLKKLVNFLIKRKHENIIIIDNNSSYPPLLKYYDEMEEQVTIERLKSNDGHLVFWKNEKLNTKYSKGYHIVTDFDIIPNDELPEDYINQLISLLNKHKEVTKIGFALRLDDLSEDKQWVIPWEKPYWRHPIGNEMYSAPIDTTFAIYPPRYRFNYANFYNGIRVAGDFLAQHGGYYIHEDNLSEEDIYYYETASNSSSWKRSIEK